MARSLSGKRIGRGGRSATPNGAPLHLHRLPGTDAKTVQASARKTAHTPTDDSLWVRHFRLPRRDGVTRA